MKLKRQSTIKSIKKALTLVIIMLFFIVNSTAFAAQYSAGIQSYTIGGKSIDIEILYIPTVNSIETKSYHPNKGFRGKYKFYNQSERSISNEFEYEKTTPHDINTFTGLQPDTAYMLSIIVEGIRDSSGGAGATSGNVWKNYTLYTDPKTPTGISFPTISKNTIAITWNNQGNPTDTSYTLQRRTDSTGWVNVVTQNNINNYTDTGLNQDTKYYYRVRVNAKHGGYIYSSELNATTAADPLLAEIKAAKSAAESAATFADSARISSMEAQNMATTAASRAQTTINQTWYSGGTLTGTENAVADITAYIRMPYTQCTKYS